MTLTIQKRRWLALQLLEGNISNSTIMKDAFQILPKIQKTSQLTFNEDPALIIAYLRYEYIKDICDSISNTTQVIYNMFTEK